MIGTKREVDRYRRRADEMRAIAEQYETPACHDFMLRQAESYDALAAFIEELWTVQTESARRRAKYTRPAEPEIDEEDVEV